MEIQLRQSEYSLDLVLARSFLVLGSVTWLALSALSLSGLPACLPDTMFFRSVILIPRVLRRSWRNYYRHVMLFKICTCSLICAVHFETLKCQKFNQQFLETFIFFFLACSSITASILVRYSKANSLIILQNSSGGINL